MERDAAIQRFKFTFEATWKFARAYLLEVEKIDAASPKAIIRSARDVGLLDDSQAMLALAMSDDRNLTSHTYNASLAQQLASRLPRYSNLLEAWIGAMERRI